MPIVFHGEYELSVDTQKNRMLLPAEIRRKIEPQRDGEAFFLVMGMSVDSADAMAARYQYRALEFKELSKETRSVAVFGVIQGHYARGDYNAVVDTYVANATALPTAEDLRPKLLLMPA